MSGSAPTRRSRMSGDPVKLYDMLMNYSDRPDPHILWVLRQAGITEDELSQSYLSNQPAWFYLRREIGGRVWEIELLPTRKKIYADALREQREHENRLLFIQQETRKILVQVDMQNAMPVLDIILDYLDGDVSLEMEISLEESVWDEVSGSISHQEDWEREIPWGCK